MEYEYRVRAATPADGALLAALIPLSARELSVGAYTKEETEAAIAYIFGVDSALVADGTYFVVEAVCASAAARAVEPAAAAASAAAAAAASGATIVACGGWSKRRTLFGGDNAKRVMGSSDPMSFVAASDAADDDVYLRPPTDAARVRAFFVHPGWARRGIGTRLFHACLAAAGAAGFDRVELMATLPGVPLYTHLGCVPLDAGRTPIPTPGGVAVPCLRMGRPITP